VTTVAVALSFAGIYAVMSFTVWQRTREIGLRVALGGSTKGIIALVFRRPLVQVGFGVFIGALVVAVLVSKGFAEVTARGAALLMAYALLMTGVCLLSAIVPVRRTLGIEPAEVLKADV
jgi:ABC-type antimicrobial peptide transport system permease subunit